MKLIDKIIIFIIILIIIFINIADAKEVYEKEPQFSEVVSAIENVNLENAVVDACIVKDDLCNIIMTKVYPKLKRKNKCKYILFYIAEVESKMKFRRGFYDKNDVSLFQLNWNNKYVKIFAKMYNTSMYNLIYDTDVAAKIALRILLINTAIFAKKKGFVPGYYQDLIPLYHNPNRIKKSYLRKVNCAMRKYKLYFYQSKKN